VLLLALLACDPGPAPQVRDSGPRDSGPGLTADGGGVFDGGSVDGGSDVDGGSGGDGGDTGPASLAGRVRITELMAANDGSVLDADGDSSDWLEIYNPGPDRVELAGWGVSDDVDDPFKEVLPTLSLLPGEYRVLWASGKAASADPSELHLGFALDADGEEVVLTAPSGEQVDAVSFGPQRDDISYGLSQVTVDTVLVDAGSVARLSVQEQGGWTESSFDDSAWTEVTLPIGYDTAASESEVDNLALFSATSQSTDGYGRTGAQAVDDEWSTFSHTGDGDLDPGWEVDLGLSSWISGIEILNRLDCCAERLYNITAEVLDEEGAVAWTSELLNPVDEGATPTSPGKTLDAGLDHGVAGRFVRISKHAVNGAGSSEWLSLAEVQVWGAPGQPYSSRINSDIEALMVGEYDTAWLRVALPPAGADRLTLELDVDDGAVAWLGEEVARLNVGPTGVVAAPRDAGTAVQLSLDPVLLDAGVLAVEVHNIAADDDDLLLDPRLVATDIDTAGPAWFDQPTPGAPNSIGSQGFVSPPTVDVDRGFAEHSFSVTVSSDTPGATLVFTLDGSVPSLNNGTLISPASTEEAPQTTVDITTTATLRAAAFRDGWGDSDVETWTWLFLDDVIRQPAAPEGFPATWDGAAQDPVAGDYEMDPDVVDDPAYTADLLAGLREIPSLSIVMPPEDLFGDDGIYVNSTQRGDDWERAGSVELILPDGSTGFAETCGVRIHGYGWRPHSASMKHSLRLEFRNEYGASKLEYPLFPLAPVDRFDSIVLRAQGSRSWQDFRDPEQALYIRDAWARDTAYDLGKSEGHATYVHLYLNGLYWGLYMPVERPDADFAAERFGGDDSEWDAINRRTSTNEAIDGDLDAYNDMLALSDAGLDPEDLYVQIQDWLDLDDLIDYMLIHQYTVNMDGPEIFESNNMRGARQREAGAQFRFFLWDMEYSIWEPTDDYNIDVDVSGSISHVYAALRQSESFRARYAARAASVLEGEGALTPAASLARFDTRADEIENAVVAESARWGDTDRALPYTRDVEWAEERRRLTEEFFPQRTAVLIEQLRAAGLYE